jgi:hypothetical protein
MSASLLLLHLLVVSSAVALDIYINPKLGSNSLVCLNGVKQPCKSLEFVSSHLGSNISNIGIIINSTSLSLNEVVTFENCDEINITGGIKDTPTNISCNLPSYVYTNGSNVSAGFIVNNASKVSLSNVLVHACGAQTLQNLIPYSAVQLHNCGNVTLRNVAFKCSVYNGLFIANSVGMVSILNVNFSLNVVHVPHNSTFGFRYYPTGMYLLLNSSESSTSRYSIIHCYFISNQFTSFSDAGSIHRNPNFIPRLNDDIGSGLGGGMGIVIMKNITQIEIVINSSFFEDNKAPWGAGLCIQFQDHVYNNSIQIVNTNFTGNSAFLGGGGVNIRFQKCSQENIVVFQGILFSNNVAKHGGGTSIISRACHFSDQHGHNLNQDMVTKFSKCTWFNNSGNYSPAIDASPFSYDHLSEGFFPLFIIKDSSFVKNHIHIPRNQMNTKLNKNFYINSGAFTVARLSVSLSGKIYFKNNSFSALVLISASARFGENSHVSFIENKGFKGGAILMYGISSLKITDNTYFEFFQNRALIDGGAIYYETIQPLDFFYGRSCFLQYSGTETNVHNRNLTLIFDSNMANHSGNSIYASTFHGCFFHYINSLYAHNITAFFNYIGNFSFDGMSKAFSSYGHKFVGNMASVDSIPGKLIDFELKLLDEFNQTIDTNFAVQVNEDSPKLALKNSFTIGNSTCVYGEEGASGTLIFSQQSTVHKVYFPIYVTLLNCAPGYFYDNNTMTCRCAADVYKRAYPFMYYCNYTEFRAYIERSYWVGYYPPNETNSWHLYTSFCPSQFCRLSKLVSSNHLLPNSSKNLSDFVCVENRTGTLCGLCKPGFSTLYHSRQLSCSNVSKHECNLGAIYYILFEIIPVSILFAVIVWFDMSFTSGNINGLIFFSQIQEYIAVDFNYYTDADSRMFNQTYLLSLQHGYHLLYGIIDMEFLNIEPLSFCLFHNSHVMQVLIFKYFTTIYAFILILFLVGFLNYCKCGFCGKLCRMRKRERSVTNGISAFLVICYVQCARVTFYILMKADLFGNKIMGSHSHVTVTYYGGLPYFKNDHLYYAIPAVLVLLTFIVFFPLYLLCFPLVLHLLAFCSLNEHPLVTKMLCLLQVNRLKPLLDTFQFSFKDRMRFFAGIYFLYRVAILSVHSSFQGNNELFLDVSVVLIVIFFGINSIAQPYISRKHNIIDSLLLLNLVAINGLTLFCLKSQARMDKMGDINYTLALSIGVLQLILLYLPLFVCVCILLYKILHLFRQRFCSTKSSTWSTGVTDDEECELLLNDKANDSDHNAGDTNLPTY